MKPCSFKQSHVGISESTCSGCSPLPATMLPIQTNRTCYPNSANNQFYKDRVYDPSQRMWLAFFCCQTSVLSITLIPKLFSGQDPLILLTIGYHGSHCPSPFCGFSWFTMTLYLFYSCRDSGSQTLVHSFVC